MRKIYTPMICKMENFANKLAISKQFSGAFFISLYWLNSNAYHFLKSEISTVKNEKVSIYIPDFIFIFGSLFSFIHLYTHNIKLCIYCLISNWYELYNHIQLFIFLWASTLPNHNFKYSLFTFCQILNACHSHIYIIC